MAGALRAGKGRPFPFAPRAIKWDGLASQTRAAAAASKSGGSSIDRWYSFYPLYTLAVMAAQLHTKSPYTCPSMHLFNDSKLTIMYPSFIELAEFVHF